MKKLTMQTPNLTDKNIERIAALFPNVIAEMQDENGKLKKGVNFELLRQELSGDIVEGGEECYDFTWVGKKQAILEGNMPIRKTLRPCKEESKNWETTENLYIEGDNLDVLKLLQESYLNKVKMIYIDPPYNTGNDFVYKDNFAMSREEYEDQIGLYDDEDNRLFRNTESNGRFHSDWCSMLYPRLKLAHNLLTEDGVIFISIGDNEVHNLRKMCDEIYGEANFRNIIAVRRYDKNINRQFMLQGLSTLNIGLEYILVYSKNTSSKFLPVFKEASKERTTSGYWKGFWNSADRPTMRYNLLGVKPELGQWKWKMDIALEAVENYTVYEKQYQQMMTLEEYWIKAGQKKRFIRRNVNGRGKNNGVEHWVPPSEGVLRNSNWSDVLASKPTGLDIPFNSPKNSELLVLLNRLTGTAESDVILDFFSGSATTAHAVMKLNAEDGGNRKFIMVQLPEKCDEKSEAYKAGYKTIAEIGKERIRRAGEQIKEEIEENAQQLKMDEEPKQVPDIGFRVLKVDSTNMKDVYYSADQYSQQMLDDMISNIKEDRTDLDLLYQVLLDWGLPLNLRHETEVIEGVSVHTVDGDALMACFDTNVPESAVREMAKRKPLRVVFRDSSFADSPSKINVEEIFKMNAPSTDVRVI